MSDNRPDNTRRRLLQAMGVGSATAIAGCLGDDDGNGNGNGEETPEPTDPVEVVEGGTLEAALRDPIDLFDPVQSTDTTSTLGQSFFYESMITLGKDGTVYPWLARSWEVVNVNDIDRTAYEQYMTEAGYVEVEDGQFAADLDRQIILRHPDNSPGEGNTGQFLTVDEVQDAVDDGTYGMHLQYELQEGVQFHNGEEMTAENVAQSYTRYYNSNNSAQIFNTVLHAEAVDEYTVNVYAQIPDAEAVRELPVNVFPSDHMDLAPGDLDPRAEADPVGTGPYVFDEYEDEQFFVVQRNEDYWVDLEDIEWWDGPDSFPNGPVVDTIDMDMVQEDATRSAALQNGEVDLTYQLVAGDLNDFDSSDEFKVRSTASTGYQSVHYPWRVEPWGNRKLRRACNHLIPREQIVEEIFDGWVEPAWVPLPTPAAGTGSVDYEALIERLKPFNEFDPERAQELLQEAIEEDDIDTPIEITLETTVPEDRIRFTELIAESFSQMDELEAEVETFERLQFFGSVLDKSYATKGTLAVYGLDGTFNPHSFVEAFHHPDAWGQCCNTMGIDDPELTEAMDEAQFGLDVLDDPQLRAERYEEIWEMVLEKNYVSFTHFTSTTAVMNTDVQEFEAYPSLSGILDYALYAPQDQQIMYIDRE